MTMRAADRVESLLAELTVDDKASLTLGSGPWHTVALPAHGVGRVKLTDGPTGARGEARSGATAACFPVGVALGATWDVDLVAAVGAALADETRTKAAHVLLGPTVNLQRTPIGGRNFECYSEDPLLTARLAVAFVRGVQGGGIGTCIKHFVANDVEFDRHEVSADLDERTLREVALLPFEIAVREADPWSVMAAYNRVNGETATAHRRLLTEILKDEWGWSGVVISDWGAVKDTVRTARAGCDLEMPGPTGHLGPRLAAAVRAGDVPETQLDDLARRVLVLAERAGRLDDATEPPERSEDDPARRALTRRTATDAMVLLANDGILPLDRTTLRRVALVGPNVEGFMIQGGGSSQVQPHGTLVGPLEALRSALGAEVEVVHEPGCTNDRYATPIPAARWVGAASGASEAPPSDSLFAMPARRDDGPVLVEMFDGQELDGDPAWTYRADNLSTTWFGRVRRLAGDDYSGRLTGRYRPAATGAHTFGLTAVGRNRLFVDGVLVIDSWEPEPGDAWFTMGSAEGRATLDLVDGQPVEVVVEFARDPAADMGGVRLGVIPPAPADRFDRAVAAARDADVAVVVVGTTPDWETEGHDRRSLALPGRQAELVEAVAAANPRTAVVVNAGSPVEMAWAERVGAVLQVWFGGEEMGPALAAVLVGDAEPGGRLPHTIPVALGDHPAAASYPGRDGHLPYDEGVHCGHRWYDAQGVEPRFAFGHGLSYTEFAWGTVTVDRDTSDTARPEITATVRVANVGDRRGSDVVQLYVAPPPGGDGPVRHLAGFAKVTLDPGTHADVAIGVDEVAFRRWDDTSATWVVDPGRYELVVGSSSRGLRSQAAIDLVGP